MKTLRQQIDEEFDRRYSNSDGWGEEGFVLSNRIKKFIHSALDRQKTEIIEMIDWILTPHDYESDDPKTEKFALELKEKYKKKIIYFLTSEDKNLKNLKHLPKGYNIIQD